MESCCISISHAHLHGIVHSYILSIMHAYMLSVYGVDIACCISISHAHLHGIVHSYIWVIMNLQHLIDRLLIYAYIHVPCIQCIGSIYDPHCTWCMFSIHIMMYVLYCIVAWIYTTAVSVWFMFSLYTACYPYLLLMYDAYYASIHTLSIYNALVISLLCMRFMLDI
jgi:hypothetical protein